MELLWALEKGYYEKPQRGGALLADKLSIIG
jgi:hypothetical protein